VENDSALARWRDSIFERTVIDEGERASQMKLI